MNDAISEQIDFCTISIGVSLHLVSHGITTAQFPEIVLESSGFHFLPRLAGKLCKVPTIWWTTKTPETGWNTCEFCEGSQNFLSPEWNKTQRGPISKLGFCVFWPFFAYSHQRRINLSTNWANNLVWIRPQKPIFWFLNELGDELKFRCGHSHREQCIGSIHGWIHQFIWSIRLVNSFLVWIGLKAACFQNGQFQHKQANLIIPM